MKVSSKDKQSKPKGALSEFKKLWVVLRKNHKQASVHQTILTQLRDLINEEDVLRFEKNCLSIILLIGVLDMNKCMSEAKKIVVEKEALCSVNDIKEIVDNAIGLLAPDAKASSTEQETISKFYLSLMETSGGKIQTVFFKFMKFCNRLVVFSVSLFDIINMREYEHSNLVLFLVSWAFMSVVSRHDSNDAIKRHYDRDAATGGLVISARLPERAHSTLLRGLQRA